MLIFQSQVSRDENMSFLYLLIFCQTQGILSSYLDVEANYRAPKVERNNIVNKGVWVRNFKENDKTGNFLFRGNSIDVDNIVQGDFNAFGDGAVPNSPFISSYVERSKRSLDHRRLRRYRKSLTNTNTNTIEENASLVKSKLLNKLKPASVFNDYPYEIAILLGNNKEALDEAKNYSTYVINEMIKNESQIVIPLTESNITKLDEIVSEVLNKTNSTGAPKRSMNHYETEVIKKIELMEDVKSNNTVEETPRSFTRDVFAKEDKAWRQSAPLPDTHKYRVIGKNDDEKSPKSVRPVTERGLIKVLSMLTNTFKKIMKQHNEIREIHKKLNTMNEDFLKNIEIISDKFQDFESKYANLVTFNQKITELDEKISNREQHFKSKERELSKNLVDFEIQQKKFLTQQRQFYNIQKLMLAQNERINAKQNAIAKTQSEISHRQNNFARILKKAKQIYIDSRYNIPKSTAAYAKPENNNNSNETKSEDPENQQTTTRKPQEATESVKINLFSIPVPAKLENQDRLLLNEKDEQPVDDLVYKYYFNNTFIDTLMRNFLTGFISTGESNDSSKNVKNKRDEITEGTTLLLPMKMSNPNNNIEEIVGKTITRKRRWINHHSRKKWRRKNRGKGVAEKSEVDDEKSVKNQPSPSNVVENEPEKIQPTEKKTTVNKEVKLDIQKSDAFISMATEFCNRIGQNSNQQVLDWCIEKALRRLQNIDIKMPPPPEEMKVKRKKERRDRSRRVTEKEADVTTVMTTISDVTTPPASSQTAIVEHEVTIVPVVYTPISTLATPDSADSFFPDNEKLESNLRQFDLKPDTEGNFYYDGSLHASDVIKDDHNGDSQSDILPGMDSNSRIDTLDPDIIDNEAMRRAFLKRTLFSRLKYESMLKKITKL